MDKKEIKKAYLTGKLDKYIEQEMANGKKIDTEAIAKYLKVVEKERQEKIDSLARFVKKTETPSVVSEGKKLTDEDKKKIYSNVKRAEALLERYKTVASNITQNTVQQEIQVIGHRLTSYELDLYRYKVLMYQKYMKKLFEVWSDFTFIKTRKEAEDFTSTTAEYYDYKSARALEKACENISINCRKEYSKF